MIRSANNKALRWTALLSSALISTAALAQAPATEAQAPTTEVQAPTTEVQVKHGEVVYVSGNDLVVRLDDGQIKQVNVPDSFRFNVDGKDVSVHELKVGTRLSQTITTTSTPRTVTDVRTVQGRVWRVNPPFVIVTLADGTNKQYRVPQGTKFNIGGQEKTVFELRPGMNLTATITTTTPEVQVAQTRTVTGSAPPPPPATPAVVGVLLIQEAPARPPAQMAAAQAPAEPTPAPQAAEPSEPAKSLPRTASQTPLIGVIGLLALSAAILLRVGRRRRA